MKNLFLVLLFIVLSGCMTSSKWAYEYYQECETSTSNLGFQALVACGKANISASCPSSVQFNIFLLSANLFNGTLLSS